jgi:hypothetical protein
LVTCAIAVAVAGGDELIVDVPNGCHSCLSPCD